MTRPPAPFAERLAVARAMVARRPAQPPPVHLADQILAAGRETRQIHDRLVGVLPMIEPNRHWRKRMDAEPTDEVRAMLLAATMGCTTVCSHLRRGGPQPSIARLALRRVDCQRCSATLYGSPAGEDDRCDVCTAPGIVTFFPFAVRLGPALIAGDACTACAGALGIAQEATA